jgi:hypothetical protein
MASTAGQAFHACEQAKNHYVEQRIWSYEQLRAHRCRTRTVVWQRHVAVGPNVLLARQRARRATHLNPTVARGVNRLSVLRLTGGDIHELRVEFANKMDPCYACHFLALLI